MGGHKCNGRKSNAELLSSDLSQFTKPIIRQGPGVKVAEKVDYCGGNFNRLEDFFFFFNTRSGS